MENIKNFLDTVDMTILIAILLAILALYTKRVFGTQKKKSTKQSEIANSADNLSNAYHAGFEAGMEKGKSDLINTAKAHNRHVAQESAVKSRPAPRKQRRNKRKPRLKNGNIK